MKQDNIKPEPNLLKDLGMEVLGGTIKACTLLIVVIIGLGVLLTGFGGRRE